MTGSALVLGGGGVAGIAWEIGLLHGLCEADVDLTGADTVVGTSAGAVAAAQITSGTPLADLYRAQVEGHAGELLANPGRGFLLTFMVAMLRSRDPQKFRKRIGASALRADTVSEAERRVVIESRLPAHEWPDRRVLITAVDAVTGEFVVFDRDAGVPLVDAVGASCAVPGIWPPVTIGGRRYIDGGVRSAANVDLAAGADRIVVIAPIARGGGPMPKVATEVAALPGDVPVALVTPDAASLRAFGRNPLDPAVREPSARAGYAQAASVADAVRTAWTAR